jgi:hypothetical protein
MIKIIQQYWFVYILTDWLTSFLSFRGILWCRSWVRSLCMNRMGMFVLNSGWIQLKSTFSLLSALIHKECNCILHRQRQLGGGRPVSLSTLGLFPSFLLTRFFSSKSRTFCLTLFAAWTTVARRFYIGFMRFMIWIPLSVIVQRTKEQDQFNFTL